jgi:aminoglycoside phosphotransferase (APT) family kinase protein
MTGQSTSSYEQYRFERLRLMTTNDTIIANAVKRACGVPLHQKTRITEGFSNEVYAASTIDDQYVIVRIHWYESPYFEAEQWALQQCAQRGLPTPKMVFLQHHIPGDIPRSLCVETRLEGVTLHSLLATVSPPADQTCQLLNEAGSLLAQVHQIPTVGFGRINGHGIAEASSWQAFIERTPREQVYQAAQHIGILASDVTAAYRVLQHYSGLWATIKPCLLHGDVSLQHFMVHQNHISGMIDFEFPASGDPAMDLAAWGYWDAFHGDSFPVDWLLAGYKQQPLDDMTFRLRLLGCRLQLSLEKLAYHGNQDKDTPGMREFLQASFQRDLDMMRNCVP